MTKRLLLQIAAGFLIGIGLGVLVLFGLAGWGERLGLGSSSLYASPAPALAVGAPAPDFELLSVSGETFRLSQFRGSPVLINFWATWCYPCLNEMPLIQQRYESYAPNLVVLAVNADEPQDTVQAYVESKALSFIVLLDPGYKIGDVYRVRGYPTSVFVDAEGVVRAIHVGELLETTIDEKLASIGMGND